MADLSALSGMSAEQIKNLYNATKGVNPPQNTLMSAYDGTAAAATVQGTAAIDPRLAAGTLDQTSLDAALTRIDNGFGTEAGQWGEIAQPGGDNALTLGSSNIAVPVETANNSMLSAPVEQPTFTKEQMANFEQLKSAGLSAAQLDGLRQLKAAGWTDAETAAFSTTAQDDGRELSLGGAPSGTPATSSPTAPPRTDYSQTELREMLATAREDGTYYTGYIEDIKAGTPGASRPKEAHPLAGLSVSDQEALKALKASGISTADANALKGPEAVKTYVDSRGRTIGIKEDGSHFVQTNADGSSPTGAAAAATQDIVARHDAGEKVSIDEINQWWDSTHQMYRANPEGFAVWAKANPEMAIRYYSRAGNEHVDSGINQEEANAAIIDIVRESGMALEGSNGRALALNYSGNTFKDINNEWGAGDFWKIGTLQTVNDSALGDVLSNPITHVAANVVAPGWGELALQAAEFANGQELSWDDAASTLAAFAPAGGEFLNGATGMSSTYGTALTAAGASALGGGDLQDVVTAGVTNLAANTISNALKVSIETTPGSAASVQGMESVLKEVMPEDAAAWLAQHADAFSADVHELLADATERFNLPGDVDYSNIGDSTTYDNIVDLPESTNPAMNIHEFDLDIPDFVKSALESETTAQVVMGIFGPNGTREQSLESAGNPSYDAGQVINNAFGGTSPDRVTGTESLRPAPTENADTPPAMVEDAAPKDNPFAGMSQSDIDALKELKEAGLSNAEIGALYEQMNSGGGGTNNSDPRPQVPGDTPPPEEPEVPGLDDTTPPPPPEVPGDPVPDVPDPDPEVPGGETPDPEIPGDGEEEEEPEPNVDERPWESDGLKERFAIENPLKDQERQNALNLNNVMMRVDNYEMGRAKMAEQALEGGQGLGGAASFAALAESDQHTANATGASQGQLMAALDQLEMDRNFEVFDVINGNTRSLGLQTNQLNEAAVRAERDYNNAERARQEQAKRDLAMIGMFGASAWNEWGQEWFK